VSYTIRNAQHLADWYEHRATVSVQSRWLADKYAAKAEAYRRLVAKLTGGGDATARPHSEIA
jgi:hypothetical protein